MYVYILINECILYDTFYRTNLLGRTRLCRGGNRSRSDKFLFFTDTQSDKFKEMTLVPYTPSEWCDIGARLWDMVCQCGDTQVQMTFINGNQMSDETLTVAPSATGLCLFHGPVSKAWQDSTLVGHIASLRASQIPNFETQVLLPAMGAARELGHQQGLITAERERLNFDYANAVADVQNRNAQLNSQAEEAHINLSVRESNIAGTGNQVLELRQQLEAALAQLREREFNLGVLTGQFQEREARHNAQQPARDAETAGRDEASATRHVANDGVTTIPHQTNILMAGGVPSSATRRGSAAYRPPPGNVARPHFHPPRRCLPALLPWTLDYPWKRTAVSAHSTSPRGPRVYGMRAPPESLWTSSAHTNTGNRTTSRLNLPLTIWSSGSARWKACRIPPIESLIWGGPYGIHS
ncbi:hypothetical protein TCDM_12027 [Trypanosoma cruzi Dm28c]|uniref:Helicase-like protein n=1 Tax=Trypanosoma cruzi Dm28c TaxID=1416333 RepID=V5CYY8_TRYCR|nr:hypothetical protein TCDM_12027 [Trypanosoma cruzi Dm28c]